MLKRQLKMCYRETQRNEKRQATRGRERRDKMKKQRGKTEREKKNWRMRDDEVR